MVHLKTSLPKSGVKNIYIFQGIEILGSLFFFGMSVASFLICFLKRVLHYPF